NGPFLGRLGWNSYGTERAQPVANVHLAGRRKVACTQIIRLTPRSVRRGSLEPDALTERLGWTVFERRGAPERSRAELSPRRTGANPPPPFRSASPALARYAIGLSA